MSVLRTSFDDQTENINMYLWYYIRDTFNQALSL